MEAVGRLSKADVFEAFFDQLAALSSSAHLVQMFDSTVVRAHVSAAGAKGAEGPGARPLARQVLDQNSPEDGFRRHPIAFDLTGGEKGDAPHFSILLGLGPNVDPRAGNRRSRRRLHLGQIRSHPLVPLHRGYDGLNRLKFG